MCSFKSVGLGERKNMKRKQLKKVQARDLNRGLRSTTTNI